MFTIALHQIHCVEDTDEFDSDEPYVLVYVSDASPPTLDGGVPDLSSALPSGSTTLYGPWGDVDPGEKGVTSPIHTGFMVPRKPFWGVDEPEPVDSPDDLFVIVALMENDEADPGSIRTAINGQISATLLGLVSEYWDGTLSRQTVGQRLETAMRDALSHDLATLAPQFLPMPGGGFGIFPQNDDLIGVRSYRIRQSHLDEARNSGEATLTRTLRGDGGEYRVTIGITFHADAAAQQALTVDGGSGEWASRPAVALRDGSVLDVVVRRPDRSFSWSARAGAAPSPWTTMGPGTFLSAPSLAVVARRGAPDDLIAVGRGEDRRLYEARSAEDWQAWRPIHDGTFRSAPTLAGRARLHLAAVGDDRRIYNASSDRGGPWTNYAPIGDGTFLSPPAAVVWRGGRVDIFAIGDDRGVYQSWWDNGWQPWRRLGNGTFQTAPAAAASSNDRLHVLCVGDDRRLYELVWTPSGWSDPWSLVNPAATFRSAPAVVWTGVGRLEAFAVGDDHTLFHARWGRGRWSGWSRFPVPGTVAPAA
ncbi:MAG: hypothetical protein AAGC60_03930 [Acidobacteriota bacterium]